ncbi:MAG: NAD-dependent epimerase/dehydratase family protein [Myxococcales bacterium]|nr:NAD-dependent epimerase/dehydratase family protein [Myxococcales bacterium]
MRVLIPGIAGSIGRLVAMRLKQGGHEIAGVDRRPWHGAAELGIEVHEVDIRKRAAEEVFRRFRPDAVVHMATVTHLTARSEDRYRINLYGTRAVFEHCHTYGAKRCLFVGRHTYYGAAADTPLYHPEEDPPMAVSTFPELGDLVAADLYAGTALWRYPAMDTLVLRLCYTLGPTLSGTLASFLRGKYVPMVLGFDPLFQFMHDHDAARAIVTALERGERGVWNVAGPPPMPLSTIVRRAGRTALPVAEPLLRFAMGRFGLPKLPRGAVTHIKFPVVIDDARFRAQAAWAPEHDAEATLDAFRRAAPL